jgi:hypothetical protein
MTVPDPANPKVRDAFIAPDGARVTVATVGKAWALVHYRDGVESPVSRTQLATWTPAPPPLIAKDVAVLFCNGYVHNATGCPNCRPLVLHPNGTWTEVAA